MTKAAAKAPKYSDEEVARIKQAYIDNPSRETVVSLAKELGRSDRAITMKLVNLDIYQPAKKVDASGKERAEPGVTKNELAGKIGDLVGLLPEEADSLTKAVRPALVKVLSVLAATQQSE